MEAAVYQRPKVVSMPQREPEPPPDPNPLGTRESIQRAKDATYRERAAYVLTQGHRDPRAGLQALTDVFPAAIGGFDVVDVLLLYDALCVIHGPATMARMLGRSSW